MACWDAGGPDLIGKRGLLGGRSSLESEHPLDLLSINMLTTKNQEKQPSPWP